MIVRDKAGQTYELEGELSRGGEGVVYRVRGHPDLLAKYYLNQARASARKIAWMAAHPPEDPTAAKLGHTSIAWPRALLYDGRRFVGFLMPFVPDARPLLEVYHPRLRARLPWRHALTWRFFHRAARNFASAMSALHAAGYVIGDINEGNIIVTENALISLIDTDSFQVRAQIGGKTQVFRCQVGKEEFTPPELQGARFANVDRTPDHDSFGMGVIIFLLLMNGTHPFRSLWRGSGDPPALSEKISRGFFPYQTPPPREIAPPNTMVRFEHLDPALQELFRRCFVDGSRPPHRRPSAEEWEGALKTAERNLIQCAQGHWYGGHIPSCPWCSPAVKGVQVPLPVNPPRSSRPPGSRPSPSRPAPVAPPPPPVAPVPAPVTGRPSRRRVAFGGGGLIAIFLLLRLLVGGDGDRGDRGVAFVPPSRPAMVTTASRTQPAIVPSTRTPTRTATAALDGSESLSAGGSFAATGEGAPFGGDPAQTGAMPGPGPAGRPVLRWRFATGGPVTPSPAVVGGTVYVGSWDNHLYALDAATGALRWRFQTPGAVISSPAVVDGTVYVGSGDGFLYAVGGDRAAER
jgi:serine/threonine protein kinase